MTYIWPCQLPCRRTPTHFPYFNAKCSSKHKLPLAEESKQFPARPNFTSAFANVGPGSAATAMPCTWGLGSCTSLSSQAALGWRHQEQTPYFSASFSTLPPGRAFLSLCSVTQLGTFSHHIFPPQGAVVWDPEDLARGLHLSPRAGGFTEPGFEVIWS